MSAAGPARAAYSTPEQRQAAASLREAGHSIEFIARKLRYSTSTVAKWLLSLGVEHPRPRQGTPGQCLADYRRGLVVVHLFTAADDARLLALEAEGLGNSAIARRMTAEHPSRPRKASTVRMRLMALARRDERALAHAEPGSRNLVP